MAVLNCIAFIAFTFSSTPSQVRWARGEEGLTNLDDASPSGALIISINIAIMPETQVAALMSTRTTSVQVAFQVRVLHVGRRRIGVRVKLAITLRFNPSL